jgi:hypothetical protein
MTLEQGDTGSGKHIIDSGDAIGACGGKFISSAIEAGVENFVIVTTEGLNALATADIPQLACTIDTSS